MEWTLDEPWRVGDMSEATTWKWPKDCNVQDMAETAENAGLLIDHLTDRPQYQRLMLQGRFTLMRHKREKGGWGRWCVGDSQTQRYRPWEIRARLWPLYLLAWEVTGIPPKRMDIAFDYGDQEDMVMALAESMGDPDMMPLENDDGYISP